MDFQFILDKYYLLLKMIDNKNNIEELEQWKNNVLINMLDTKVIEEIENEKGTIEEYFICGDFEQLILNNNLDLKLNRIMEDDMFLKYYNKTLEYMNTIQNYWSINKNRIIDWLKDTIKLNPFKESINVYVIHPNLNTGKCVEQNFIFWGHYKGITDPNYNVVYLCHEYLHAILPNYNCMPPAMSLLYGKSASISYQEQWKLLNSSIENYDKIYQFEADIIHTVIELISDNELYTVLSGSSKYSLGHHMEDDSLLEYKELILPYWFQYMGMSSVDMKKRVPNFKSENKEILKESDKLNIENFINFLINNSYLRNKLKVPELIHDNLSDEKKLN